MSDPARLLYKSLSPKMKSTVFLIAALLGMSPYAAQSTALERSTSPSGQFVIYGGDAISRGAISSLAEQTKADLLAVLRQPDDWKVPVVIKLEPLAANLPDVPATDLRFSQTDAGLKFQLDLKLAEQIDSLHIEYELMRVLLLEMVYRNQSEIAAGNNYVEPPPWLINGLLTATPHRDNASLKEALSASDHIVSLDEFLAQRPELLDSAGRFLYRAYSFALIQMLLETSDGRARVGRYIENLSFTSNNPLSDLENIFPELARNPEIWKGKVVSLAKRSGLLSFSLSEEQLAEVLDTRFPSDARGKSLSLEDLCQKKLNRPQQLALQKFTQELIRFSEHANPVLRPVVEDYERIAVQTGLGKNRGAIARLSQLKKVRAKLSARMTDVDDYLNWFEATQLTTASGAFDDYLNSANESRNEAYRRTDAISVYLDAVEQQN